MEREEIVARIFRFLDRIGIAHRERTPLEGTFLPGITIDGGTVYVDPGRLRYPGDLLHEAGHIALAPPTERAQLDQAVLGSRPAHQSEEVGVLLWTYFAAKEAGVPLETIFHAGGYKGESAWLVEQFESGTLIGLPLLSWMGVTETDASGVVRVRSWLRCTEP